ncbi:hypothetical protein H261_16912 [Paramagnetospirillum caucaseum]|uniref:DHHA1 domain-containing protein n=1 Tax=Paramagnetospirillum caucaseum TaxID=1244869 RepID=M2ZN60_9PROT|nr:DHHA1 domain-containing protein [Paramagnetospirillum caucaseum]EME68727.1 hypothetical protein H261_16912 [Paramagnetospirillum caucaseum]
MAFHPGVYGTPPPDVIGRDVILVDFSYKRPVMEALCRTAASVLVLDHHKTAAAELGGLEEWAAVQPVTAAVTVHIDMEKSGAVLAWEHFHPGKPIPRLLQHVQDRDLWRFALPGTREILACVFSHPFDFDRWDELAEEIECDPTAIQAEGAAIERKHHKDIAELLNTTTRPMIIGGYCVPIANLPYTLASDAGHALCRGDGGGMAPPFAGIYYDRPGGRTFSLRSSGDFDVSAIARKYGGGGHKNAAGFTMSLGWEGDCDTPNPSAGVRL